MIIIYNYRHMMIHLSFAVGFGCNIGHEDSIVRKLYLMMVDRTKMQFTYLQLFFFNHLLIYVSNQHKINLCLIFFILRKKFGLIRIIEKETKFLIIMNRLLWNFFQASIGYHQRPTLFFGFFGILRLVNNFICQIQIICSSYLSLQVALKSLFLWFHLADPYGTAILRTLPLVSELE